MPARAGGALTGRAQLTVGIEALVRVGPGHSQSLGLLLDVARPAHGGREPLHLRARAAGTRAPEPVEGIDAAVTVGPGDTDGIASYQVDVAGNVRIRLPDD